MRMHLDIYTKRSSHVISHIENEADEYNDATGRSIHWFKES